MTAYAPRSSLNYAARPSCKFYNSCGCRYGRECRFIHAPHEHSVNGVILEELHVIKSTINTSHHMLIQHCNAMQIEIDRMKMEMKEKKEKQQQQQQQLCIETIQNNDAALHQQPSQRMKCYAASKQQQQQQQQQLDELQIENKRLKKELKDEKKKKKKEMKHVAVQTNAATLNHQQQQQQLRNLKMLQIENEKLKNELKEEKKAAMQANMAALDQQQQQQQLNELQIENKKLKKEMNDIKKKKSKQPQCKQCKAASKTQQQLKHQTKLLRQQCEKYEEAMKQQQQRYQELQHEKENMEKKLNVIMLKKVQCVAVQTDGIGTDPAQQQQSDQGLEIQRNAALLSNDALQQQYTSQQKQQQQRQQLKQLVAKIKRALHVSTFSRCKICNGLCVDWMCLGCDMLTCKECVCECDQERISLSWTEY